MIEKMRLKAILKKAETYDKKSILTFESRGLYSDLIKIKLFDKKNEEVFLKLQSFSEFKTECQNKVFHALINKYWSSGLVDYSSFLNASPDSWKALKIDIKARLSGLDIKEVIIKKQRDILTLPKGDYVQVGQKIYCVPSWSSFTVSQATKTIDNLITEMIQKGIDVSLEVVEVNELKKKKENDSRNLPLF